MYICGKWYFVYLCRRAWIERNGPPADDLEVKQVPFATYERKSENKVHYFIATK
jgi:hypothetical protein